MIKLIPVMVTLWLLAPLGASADIPGKARACSSCHGQQGISSNPQWPNLAGQRAGYLAVQLKAFRDGKRSNPAMIPFVRGLSDSDIDELAGWFSSLPAQAAANGSSALVAKGENLSAYCKACHGMQGKPAASVWPSLAGQHAPYLLSQLLAFEAGERKNPHMQTVLAPFGQEEFKALAAYYSQLKP